MIQYGNHFVIRVDSRGNRTSIIILLFCITFDMVWSLFYNYSVELRIWNSKLFIIIL